MRGCFKPKQKQASSLQVYKHLTEPYLKQSSNQNVPPDRYFISFNNFQEYLLTPGHTCSARIFPRSSTALNPLQTSSSTNISLTYHYIICVVLKLSSSHHTEVGEGGCQLPWECLGTKEEIRTRDLGKLHKSLQMSWRLKSSSSEFRVLRCRRPKDLPPGHIPKGQPRPQQGAFPVSTFPVSVTEDALSGEASRGDMSTATAEGSGMSPAWLHLGIQVQTLSSILEHFLMYLSHLLLQLLLLLVPWSSQFLGACCKDTARAKRPERAIKQQQPHRREHHIHKAESTPVRAGG